MYKKVGRFILEKEIVLSLPTSYCRKTLLDSFFKKYRKNNLNLIDVVFDKNSYEGIEKKDLLISNQTYIVKFFTPLGPPMHNNSVKIYEWSDLLKSQNSIFCGVHGFLALQKYKEEELPIGYNYFSLGSFPFIGEKRNDITTHLLIYFYRNKNFWSIREQSFGYNEYHNFCGGKSFYLSFVRKN